MTHQEAYDYIREHADPTHKATDFMLNTKDGQIYLIRMRPDNQNCLFKHVYFLKGGYRLASLMWILCDLVEFVKTYIMAPHVDVEIVAHRKYGKPKLVKPKEIKGIKGKSLSFIPKRCAFQYFKTESDIYILCRDFFSPTFVPPEKDRNMSVNELLKKYFAVRKTDRFIYCDSFGSIVLRNEAWVRIRNYKTPYRQIDSASERKNFLQSRFRKGFHKAGFDLTEDDFYWNDFIERLDEEIYKEK